MSDRLAYTVPEAAKALGVCRASIYRAIKAGDLVTVKFCGRTLIRAEDLAQALDRAQGKVAA